jgi:2-polyprenyl-3-methyl-5-hydroxy-6-metoxy-1,4-benzoquinol methylase
MGRFVNDLGATYHAGMVVIGERLGLYKALAGQAMTSVELAQRTGTDERYVREWLSSQAAGGYVTYEGETGEFSLNDEQAFALAVEDGPAYIPGAFELVTAALKSVPRIIEAFRSGAGIGWHEHDEGVFRGCERFFRPGYVANLVSNWIPALDGVEAKLKAGAIVADVGCGHGASAILLAQAYPQSRVMGFDYHEGSIIAARAAAQAAGVSSRVQFEIASAKNFPGQDYDLIAMFDCLHDMGDPAGAAEHVLQSLKKTGHWMIVEPFANDTLSENLGPVGRVFYGASTLLCTPCSRSQEVGLCLGAQAGERRLRNVVTSAGFRHFRRAAETPFNLVFEARP